MAPKTLRKPSAFQNEFLRKPGPDKQTTHYCPGCGHGVVHKLIAETLSDFGVQDRTILVAPVGCAVFLYYYFGCAAVSVPHGRAPAALTGISRAHEDAISISYQGDGDLAAIGLAEILHAANRGERMAVFFVNNAIYGMTGGQMAPTTLVGMPTATSPRGRDPRNDGYPMRICEMLAGFEAPVYIERTTLADNKGVMRTRAAVRKALQVQVDRKGFALVEILSPCATNWRINPKDAGKWIEERMHPVFPPGVYKDVVDQTESVQPERIELNESELYALMGLSEADRAWQAPAPTRTLPGGRLRFKLAGAGGEGIQKLGVLAAEAGAAQGYEVTWLPSYGPEMRGGTSNANVILSDRLIGSPLVTEIDVLLAMNAPSLERFLPDVVPGGTVLYNASVVDEPPTAEGVVLHGVPTLEIAQRTGEPRTANTVLFGAYNALADIFDDESLERALRQTFPKEKVVQVNLKAFEAGAAYAREHFTG